MNRLWTLPIAIQVEIVDERRRQEFLKASGRFLYTLADPEMSGADRLACVVEEVGEVARCVLAGDGLATDALDPDGHTLRRELVQVAALCVAWLEALDG